MLKKLLRAPRDLLLRGFDAVFGGDEWRRLLDFVSPSFFDVVPLRTLIAQGRELVSNAADGRGRARVEAEVTEAIAARGLALRLGAAPEAKTATRSAPRDAATRGQRVLELYFVQLFGAQSSLIDLRPGSFADDSHATLWSPGPCYLCWDPDFLAALRTLYEGFYAGDEAAFDAGFTRSTWRAARSSSSITSERIRGPFASTGRTSSPSSMTWSNAVATRA